MRFSSFTNTLCPELKALTCLKTLQGSSSDNGVSDIELIFKNIKTANERRMTLGPVLVLLASTLLPSGLSQPYPVLRLFLAMVFIFSTFTYFTAELVCDKISTLTTPNASQALILMEKLSPTIYAPGICLKMSMFFFLCALLHLLFPRAINPGPVDTRTWSYWLVFGIATGTIVVALVCFLLFAARARSMGVEGAKVEGPKVEGPKVDKPLAPSTPTPPSTPTSDIEPTGVGVFLQRIKWLVHFPNPWKKRGDVEWQTPKLPPGITNLGDTCYISAVVQCLNSLELFTNMDGKSMLLPQGEMGRAFSDLLESMWQEKLPPTVVDPSLFYKTLRQILVQFQEKRQQDASEFFTLLLNRFCEDQDAVMMDVKPEPEKHKLSEHEDVGKNIHLVNDIFRLSFNLTRACYNCKKSSKTSGFLRQLSVSLKGRPSKTSLAGCLNAFFTEPNQCDFCNAVKGRCDKTRLTEAPRILVIDFKRWENVIEKMVRPVKFPFSLDLAPYMDPAHKQSPHKYALRGVVHHVGANVHTGHYTASIFFRGRWLRCDDQRITEITKDNINTETSYILFYKRLIQ